jgi:hypothetical protein
MDTGKASGAEPIEEPPRCYEHPEGQEDTMDQPSSPRIQSSAPSFAVATLAQVLAEIETAHPEYGQRPIHAAAIVVGRKIEAGESGRAWYVQSETDPAQDYLVGCAAGFDLWSCSCKDWQQRGGTVGVCKHTLAVQMLAECERRERGPEPPPVPFPVRAYADDSRFELTVQGAAYLAALDAAAPRTRCLCCTGTRTAHNAACPLVADEPAPGVAA